MLWFIAAVIAASPLYEPYWQIVSSRFTYSDIRLATWPQAPISSDYQISTMATYREVAYFFSGSELWSFNSISLEYEQLAKFTQGCQITIVESSGLAWLACPEVVYQCKATSVPNSCISVEIELADSITSISSDEHSGGL